MADDITPDTWIGPLHDMPHDHKGFSEEKCIRCGWVMGHQPLNCMNDNTPHRFPSQADEIDRMCAVVVQNHADSGIVVSDDIVTRLRRAADPDNQVRIDSWHDMAVTAADEIERLRTAKVADLDAWKTLSYRRHDELEFAAELLNDRNAERDLLYKELDRYVDEDERLRAEIKRLRAEVKDLRNTHRAIYALTWEIARENPSHLKAWIDIRQMANDDEEARRG